MGILVIMDAGMLSLLMPPRYVKACVIRGVGLTRSTSVQRSGLSLLRYVILLLQHHLVDWDRVLIFSSVSSSSVPSPLPRTCHGEIPATINTVSNMLMASLPIVAQTTADQDSILRRGYHAWNSECSHFLLCHCERYAQTLYPRFIHVSILLRFKRWYSQVKSNVGISWRQWSFER